MHYSSIPCFFQTKTIKVADFQKAISGKFRFNRDKYTEVVRACPGVSSQVIEAIIEAVTLGASCDDGSLDVMKSGIVLGGILRETEDNEEVKTVANWINDLDRLPMYQVE